MKNHIDISNDIDNAYRTIKHASPSDRKGWSKIYTTVPLELETTYSRDEIVNTELPYEIEYTYTKNYFGEGNEIDIGHITLDEAAFKDSEYDDVRDDADIPIQLDFDRLDDIAKEYIYAAIADYLQHGNDDADYERKYK